MVRMTRYREAVIMLTGWAAIFGFSMEGAIAQSVSNSADYHAYVNWDYQHRNDLQGWKYSSELILASLKQWGYSHQIRQIENTDANGLQQFQQAIVSQSSKGLKLIYLASHQTPSGRIDFPNKSKAFWSEAFTTHDANSGDPSILLLDVCHADVIPQVRMNGRIPFHFILSASAANEETYEMRMFSRRPVDFRRRFPAEVQWMKEQLGPKWKGQVSFTGFIWVRQFLQTPVAPQSHAEWKRFLIGMEQEAARFAKERSRYLSSSLKVWE